MVFRQIEMEIIGSFVINFVVGYTRLYAAFDSGIDSTPSALVYGICIMVFIMLSFPFTKCHFTPILTIAEMVFGKIQIKEGITLIFSQFIGIFISVAVQLICMNDKQIAYLSSREVIGFFNMNPNFSVWNHFWIETFFTAIYVYICFEFSNPKVKRQYWIEFYAVARGSLMIAALLVGENMRYVSMNPTIVFAVQLFYEDFHASQWSYFIGPLVGVFLGGILHNKAKIEEILNDLRVSK